MKKALAILAAGAFVALGSAPAQATTPTPTYSFTMKHTLADQVGTATLTAADTCTNSTPAADYCNIAANYGKDSNGDYWHWRTEQVNGGGAVLDTPAALGSNYTIYIKFAVDDESNDTDADCNGSDNDLNNYSLIINTSNSTSDYGLYTAGCNPLYLSTGFDTGEASVKRGDVVEAVLTRDNSLDELTVYINYANGFEESWVVDDSALDFLIASPLSGSRLRLFQDDGIDDSAEGVQEGRLYGIKLWANTVLTLDEIEPLATVTPDSNKPEALAPTGANAQAGLWVILLALVATAGAVAVRRNVKA